jgi:hypothetical protein
MALGKATVNITANLKPLRKALMQARASVKSSIKKIGATIKKIKVIAAGVQKSLRFVAKFSGFNLVMTGLRKIAGLAKIAALAILGIGIASVKIASDVNETENLFRISMGNMAESADAWVKQYSNSLGLFTNDTKKALGTFQLMLTSMGIAEDKSFELSKGLTQLVNDISSFRNQRPEEVFLKLQAGITGESEPLKRLGILVNENTIKQLALTDATIQARLAVDKNAESLKEQIKQLSKVGKTAKSIRLSNLKDELKKTTDAAKKQTLVLTDAEKIMLRYKAIVNATRRDQGDMKRTMDETANVFRVVAAQIKVTANTIGKVLLPTVTRAGVAIRDFFINNQPMIKQWAEVALTAIQKVVKWLNITFRLATQGRFGEIFKEIGRLFAELLARLVELLAKIIPQIAKIGVVAGKAFADGFMQEIKGSGIGRFIGGIGDVAANIAAPFQIGGIKGREGFRETEGRRIESTIGTIGQRARGEVVIEDRGNADILQELKRIRQAAEDNIRDF